MFRWGIIGLGRIAHKFAQELTQTSLGVVGAAASRDLAKAEDFTALYGGVPYGDYDDFISDASVDAVYVAVPHHLHFVLASKCIEKGIPVLCEKPFTINLHQSEALVALARARSVFLMEAMWTRFMPHILWLNEFCRQGSLGHMLHLKAEFCFKGKERGLTQGVSRLLQNELGGGALLDIGIYPIFLSLLLLGGTDEINAQAVIVNDIDESCNLLFKYNRGTTAYLESSIMYESAGQAILYFEQGSIIIPLRWHESNEIWILRPDGSKEIKKWDYPSRGFYYEMKEVQECVEADQKESKLMPLDFSLELTSTLDRVRKIIGLHYPADLG